MNRPLFFLSAALTMAVAPFRAVQSAQPPVSRSVPARAIEASIEEHVTQHPKSKTSTARAKASKVKNTATTDVVASVKPTAPRPAMRRQSKPAPAEKKTP